MINSGTETKRTERWKPDLFRYASPIGTKNTQKAKNTTFSILVQISQDRFTHLSPSQHDISQRSRPVPCWDQMGERLGMHLYNIPLVHGAGAARMFPLCRNHAATCGRKDFSTKRNIP